MLPESGQGLSESPPSAKKLLPWVRKTKDGSRLRAWIDGDRLVVMVVGFDSNGYRIGLTQTFTIEKLREVKGRWRPMVAVAIRNMRKSLKDICHA